MKKKFNILKSSGFSLIELSMVLVLAGLIMVPVLTAYNIQKHQNKEDVTEGNLNVVSRAINKFVTLEARYPRPARFSDMQGDPTYGLEGPASPALCTDANWFASSGMCLTTGAVPVLIGAVPFDAIGLNPDIALDYWKNKLLYAVTLRQTSAGTYVETTPSTYGGSIQIQALHNADVVPGGQLLTVTDSGGNDELQEIILISHGEQGIGAYSADGTPVRPCRSPAQEFEDENCNMDEIFIASRHPRTDNTRPALYSLGEGNGRYYDDYTRQQPRPTEGAWSNPSETDPTQPVAWAGASRIGIGTEDPQAKLHVEGSIQIDNRLRTPLICDRAGNCFPASLLMGDDPNMSCNDINPSLPNRPVVRIGGSRVHCGTTTYNTGSGSTAPNDGDAYEFEPTVIQPRDCTTVGTGGYINGFDASGSPTCSSTP